MPRSYLLGCVARESSWRRRTNIPLDTLRACMIMSVTSPGKMAMLV